MTEGFHGPKSKSLQGMTDKAANAKCGKTDIPSTGFSGRKPESATMSRQKAKAGMDVAPTTLKAQNPGARKNAVRFPESMNSARSSTTPNRRTRY